ncbi:MAG: two pore domain potassium channel family protein [Clostridia bacterium]|nr:two pore domain potassium channel family protein [Clostridia bacterium]
MAALNNNKRQIIYRIIGSVLLCIAVLFSAMVIGNSNVSEDLSINVGTTGIYLGLALVVLGIYELFVFFYFIKKNNTDKTAYFHLAYAAVYFVACALAFCSQISSYFFLASCTVYLFTPILKRIASSLRNRTKRNIIFNSIVGLFNLLLFGMSIACFFLESLKELSAVLLVSLVMLISSLGGVAALALSNFNVDLLKKIIRKTYAGEILFGLLLLIISFSIALTTLEQGIETFGDALWYCFAIVTTIGFGDITASTLIGRVISVLLGIYGLVVVAIITSIIVNFYNEVKANPDDEEQAQISSESQSEEKQISSGGEAVQEESNGGENQDEQQGDVLEYPEE